MRLLIAIIVLLSTAAAAVAQPSFSPIYSLETQVDLSQSAFLATVAEFSTSPDGTKPTVTFQVSEWLKSKGSDTISFPASAAESTYLDWKRRKVRLLVLNRASEPTYSHTIIEIDNPGLALPRADFSFMSGGPRMLAFIRQRIKLSPDKPVNQYYSRPLPSGDAGRAWIEQFTVNGSYFGSNSGLAVPIDENLEKWAHGLLKSSELRDLQTGFYVLGYFKSDQNIKLAKTFLKSNRLELQKDAQSNMGVEEHSYVLRQLAVDLLEKWGIDIAKPELTKVTKAFDKVTSITWAHQHRPLTGALLEELSLFPNLVHLGLEAQKLNFADLKQVSRLKSLRSLRLTASEFQNGSLLALADSPHLEEINAANTGLNDDGLRYLAQIKPLRQIEIDGTEVTEAALIQLAKDRPDLKVMGNVGGEAFLRYARAGDLEGVKRFLEGHADLLEYRGHFGSTALHLASAGPSVAVVEYLLNAGLNVNSVNARNETPLSIAVGAYGPNDAIIRLLVARGANVNATDAGGNAALHRLARYGKPRLLALLTGVGADPLQQNGAGESALSLAKPHSEDHAILERAASFRKADPVTVPLVKADCQNVIYELRPGSIDAWTMQPMGAIVGDLKWSRTPTGRDYLGPFGQQKASLALSDLKPHLHVTVEIDLWILDSWDGNGDGAGPDIMEISVGGLGKLLYASFYNNDEGLRKGLRLQSFPQSFMQGFNEAYTGAAERRVPDLVPGSTRGAIYRLQFTFSHNNPHLKLDFSGLTAAQDGVKDLEQDERWGIGRIVVRTD